IRTGTVWINTWGAISEDFEEGGVKGSGYGYLARLARRGGVARSGRAPEYMVHQVDDACTFGRTWAPPVRIGGARRSRGRIKR
ncbi:hypothetical protein ABZX83_14605, partial [Streptomyces thermoviolaceus]|uniref:hypothetical protein n=1 Tax=Streptomyces thermoviolaceus TaxID=1952 RepID=UPI0033A7C83F